MSERVVCCDTFCFHGCEYLTSVIYGGCSRLLHLHIKSVHYFSLSSLKLLLHSAIERLPSMPGKYCRFNPIKILADKTGRSFPHTDHYGAPADSRARTCARMSIFKVSLCWMRGEATHNGAPRRDVDMRPVLAVVPLEWSSACSALAPVNQGGGGFNKYSQLTRIWCWRRSS